MKYDKYGRLIWNTTVPDWYATNNIDIELDSQGNILLMGDISMLYDIHGPEQWGNQIFHPLQFDFPGCNLLLIRGRSDCFDIPAVSATEAENRQTMTLTPNPASGMVQIETEAEPEYLEVVNPSGIVEYAVRNPGRLLDVSKLSSGFYTVRIVSPGRLLTSGLIVIH